MRAEESLAVTARDASGRPVTWSASTGSGSSSGARAARHGRVPPGCPLTPPYLTVSSRRDSDPRPQQAALPSEDPREGAREPQRPCLALLSGCSCVGTRRPKSRRQPLRRLWPLSSATVARSFERMDMQETTRQAARQRRRRRRLMVGTTTGLIVTGLLVCLVMTMQPDRKEDAGPAVATAVANSQGTFASASPGRKPSSASPSATSTTSVTPSAGSTTPKASPSRRLRRHRSPRGRLRSRPRWPGGSGPRSATRGWPRFTRPGSGTAPARTVRAAT